MTRRPAASSAQARLEILTRVNRALAGDAAQPEALPAYPQSAPLGRAELLHQFEDRILDYRAEYRQVRAAELAPALAEALGPLRRLVVPAGVPPEWLPPEALAPGLTLLRDEPAPLSHTELDSAEAVLTGCAAAISETGTIILDHREDQGRRALTLIPDQHLCVVRVDQIVQTVREGVEAVAPSVRAGRPLTWLSGGSATSDIELVRVEGVHGPRRLQVFVVE